MSAAWRWENVPRRVSWPTSRTSVPSRSSEPIASASASDQSTSPRATSSSRAANWRASFGWSVNPSGTEVVRAATRRSVASSTPVGGAAGSSGTDGVGHRARARHRPLAHLVEDRLELLVEVLERLLGLLHGEVAAADEGLGVELAHGALGVDHAVHERLGVARVVALVVPVAPVADEVDDDVGAERLAELEGEPHRARARLGVVAVHVEDRRLDHLGDVGRVERRARVLRGVVNPTWLLMTRCTVPPVR